MFDHYLHHVRPFQPDCRAEMRSYLDEDAQAYFDDIVEHLCKYCIYHCDISLIEYLQLQFRIGRRRLQMSLTMNMKWCGAGHCSCRALQAG